MYEMGEQLERVILAGVQTYESDDTVQSLYELRELAETAGAVTVGRSCNGWWMMNTSIRNV